LNKFASGDTNINLLKKIPPVVSRIINNQTHLLIRFFQKGNTLNPAFFLKKSAKALLKAIKSVFTGYLYMLIFAKIFL